MASGRAINNSHPLKKAAALARSLWLITEYIVQQCIMDAFWKNAQIKKSNLVVRFKFLAVCCCAYKVTFLLFYCKFISWGKSEYFFSRKRKTSIMVLALNIIFQHGNKNCDFWFSFDPYFCPLSLCTFTFEMS